MLLLPEKSAREIEQACAAALFSPMQWTPLADRLPVAREHVMVRMDDGIVEILFWDSAKADWSQNPFARRGRPVAWAALPRFQPASGFGRAAA